MSNDSGHTTSVWMPTPVPTFPSLTTDTTTDVCVIGAGIAGLTTAYLLTEAGKSVIVLDDGSLSFFDTGPCLHFPRQAQFHPLLGIIDWMRRMSTLLPETRAMG